MEKIKISVTNEILYHRKLDNGLEIFILPNSNQMNYYITYNVKFGSSNIEFKNSKDRKYTKVPSGIAHYIEHLKFNTENGSAFDYYSKYGASVNAFTSYDITCYEVFSSTYFKENLLYLLKLVENPYFTTELINNERDIIKEEILMYDNNPSTELAFRSLNNVFIKDSRKHLISGTVDDIKKINKDNILKCYNTFYTPNNMFVVITGNIDPNEAITIIEEHEKNNNKQNNKIVNQIIEEPKEVYKEFDHSNMNVETNKVSISYKIPIKTLNKLNIQEQELKVYISLIYDILFGSTSNIEEELITSKIINNEININKMFTKDYIIVSLCAETDYPDQFIKRIKKGMPQVTTIELRRKIKVYKSNYLLHFDDIELVNNIIQDNIIDYNEYVNSYLDICNNISCNKINEIIKKIKDVNTSTVIINPIKD